MAKPSRHNMQHERGAAAVEFALVLPILLLLVFGIVDFGRAYNAKISLSGAAREGARALALGNANWEQVTIDAAPTLTGVIASTPTGSPCATGDPAQVNATASFDYITPLPTFAGFGGGSVTLTGIGVMRCGG